MSLWGGVLVWRSLGPSLWPLLPCCLLEALSGFIWENSWSPPPFSQRVWTSEDSEKRRMRSYQTWRYGRVLTQLFKIQRNRPS